MASGMFVPQLVTPVDTSFLRQIGNTIGTLKQDSEIAGIVKGIDPYDPNSKTRVIGDLRAHGSREARDMADRLEGLDIRRQTVEQQGEYQRGQLDVARDRLGLEQKRFGLEQEDTKAFREGLAKYGRGGGLAGIPPAAPNAASAAPMTRGHPAATPADDPDDDWADATEEEGGRARPAAGAPAPIIRAPAPRSAAPGAPVVGGFATQPAPGVRAAGGLLATGAAPAPAGPAPIAPQRLLPGPFGPMASTAVSAAAPTVMGAANRVAEATPLGMGARAATGIPAGAPAAAAVPTQVAAAEAPVEDEGDLPGTEELPAPGTPQPRAAPDYTPRQIELRQANRELGNLMDYAKTPGRQRALQTHIDENNAEFAEIEAARTRGDKEREAARKAVTGQAAKDRSKYMMELGKQTQGNIDLRDNLKALKRTVNSPNYPGGVGGSSRAYIGALGIEVNKLLKEYTGVGLDERLGPDAYNRWFQDVASRRRTAESLINAITLKGLGGTVGRDVSNADREYVARINGSLSDDPETISRIVDMHVALLERQDKMFKIAVQGEKKGKTAAQIQARLSRYGKENPLFEREPRPGEKFGEPTELGRTIDPSNARDYDAEQKAIRGRTAKAREDYRDTSGTGEAAVMGGRPTPAQIRATREFDAAVRDVPGRPVTGAGSSRGETGREVREAATEGISARIPTFGEAQEGARELLRGDNPATRFFRGPGRMDYGAAGTPVAPQRIDQGGFEDIRGIVEQGSRLAPGGIPWEAYRRSTNVENRPEPNETPTPLRRQMELAENYVSGRDHPPAGPLSFQAGLADLTLARPGIEARAQENELRSILGDRMYEQTRGGTTMPSGPISLPPLPRPKPRRREEKRR